MGSCKREKVTSWLCVESAESLAHNVSLFRLPVHHPHVNLPHKPDGVASVRTQGSIADSKKTLLTVYDMTVINYSVGISK